MTTHDVGFVLAERYRLDRLIGEGGMGRVFEAEHVLMRKRVAVKILHADLTRVPEVVARFEREAMAAANIEHANVAAATDFGKLGDGTVFLVLEYVQGTSLREVVDQGPVEPQRAVRIARQIALGLASAHALGIVHRDLKPENVMLVQRPGEVELVKILDFGIAKIDEAPQSVSLPKGAKSITKVGMVFGTPEYMAPEQALGQAVDARADLYALGVILYELLAGVRPYAVEDAVQLLARQLSEPPPSFAARVPGLVVPRAIEALTLSLLHRDAAARPANAADVAAALEVLSTERGVSRYDTMASQPFELAAEPAAPPSGSALDRALAHPAVAPLVMRTERAFEPLRRQLPAQLQRVTVVGWLGIAFGVLAAIGLVLLIVVAATGVAVRRAAKHEPGADAAASASASNQAQASPSSAPPSLATGAAALAERVAASPKDAKLLVDYAVALAEEERHAEALARLEKALVLEPSVADDPRVEGLVDAASRRPESGDTALDLMKRMGAKGTDMAHELATRPKVSPQLKQRADQWLRTEDAKRSMSPALGIAIDLQRAPSCQAKKELFSRAAEVGDARALPPLRALQSTVGCGWRNKKDCFPCVRGDRKLAETIAAINARVKPR